MAKVVLNNITSGYASVSAINANNNLIETAFENTLSRDGTTPNTMVANLDMNGFSILNQGNPITVTGFNWEGSWLTATAYQVGDVVEHGGTAYICIVAHTSGTFATDLAALKWQLVATASLPAQTGHSGEVLTTDGSTASWGTLASLDIARASTTASSGANSNITSLSALTEPTGFRNKLIGGDFAINPWQRGTTFTAPVTSTYIADRWAVVHSSDAIVDILKTADAPTASQAGVYTSHCLHVDVTTADAAIAAGQYYMVNQLVEGYNAASFGFGQSGTRHVTLSFWVKATKTGIYCVAFQNSATNRSYIAEYTVNISDTWEKKTISIAVDTTGTWLYNSGIGLRVRFVLAGGSTYQTTGGTWAAGNYFATSNQVNALDSTSNNFKLALVQLEAGSVATPYEKRLYDQELDLCLSRCEIIDMYNIGPINHYYNGAGIVSHPFSFKKRKSIVPTSITKTGTAFSLAGVATSVATTCSSVDGFRLDVTLSGAGSYQAFGGAGSYILVEAEL